MPFRLVVLRGWASSSQVANTSSGTVRGPEFGIALYSEITLFPIGTLSVIAAESDPIKSNSEALEVWKVAGLRVPNSAMRESFISKSTRQGLLLAQSRNHRLQDNWSRVRLALTKHNRHNSLSFVPDLFFLTGERKQHCYVTSRQTRKYHIPLQLYKTNETH